MLAGDLVDGPAQEHESQGGQPDAGSAIGQDRPGVDAREADEPDDEADPAERDQEQVAEGPVDADRAVGRVRQSHEGDRAQRREDDDDPAPGERVLGDRRQAVAAAHLPPREEAADEDHDRGDGGQHPTATEGASMHPQSWPV